MRNLDPVLKVTLLLGQGRHASLLLAPGKPLYVFNGQGVHGLEPVTFLYVPAGHLLQATPSQLAVVPSLHLQEVLSSFLSELVTVFGGHCVHTLGLVAAVDGW